MSKGTADNRATANDEAERDIDSTDDFMLGIYLGNLKNEKFVFDYRNPDGAYEIGHAEHLFSKGEGLFKGVRQYLRKHGRGGLVEEIKDLRAERKEYLDKIKEIWLQPITSDDGEWHGAFADICSGWDKSDGTIRAYVRIESMSGNIKHTFKHAPDEKALASTVSVLPYFIERYNALIDDEAKFVDTALTNLRGWKSATGADIAELKPEIVRGANAAETMLGKLSAFLAALPDRFKRAVGRMSKSKDPLYKSCDEAVFEAWQKFKDGESDPEMPDGTWRQKGGKRGVEEFLAVYGNKKIYNGQTLNEICKSNIDELGKIIGRKNKQRQRAKANAEK